MPKIDEKAKLKTGCLQVICSLRLMLFKKFGDSFNLNDDFIVTDEVRLIRVFEYLPIIGQRESLLGNKRNLTAFEFDLQTFLIDRFEEAVTQNLVNIHTSASDRIALVRIKQHRLPLPSACSAIFRVFRVFLQSI